MMFKQGFVVAIRNDNGEVLRESSGQEVYLPFESEYSLRLKNNNNRRAVAEIFIDGTKVLGDHKIIVDANSFVDVERFCIDGDLNSGRKLRFVKADESDSRVQDPTSPENGIVKVRFWLEKNDRTIIINHNPWGHNWDYWSWKKHTHNYEYDPPDYVTGKQDRVSGSGKKGGFCAPPGDSSSTMGYVENVGSSSVNYSCNLNDSLEIKSSAGFMHRGVEEKGATVEGSYSSQSFSEGTIGELETRYTEIVLTIKASKSPVTVRDTRTKYCSDCGYRAKRMAKFCMECGKRF